MENLKNQSTTPEKINSSARVKSVSEHNIPAVNLQDLDNPSKDSTLSEDYFIFVPPTKTTPTTKFILNLAMSREKQISQFHGNDVHPDYYLTIDKFHEIVQAEKSLPEEHKNVKSVNESFMQMMDYYSGGKQKFVYMYPVFVQVENSIQAKILLIAPQSNKPTPVSKYRDVCFKYSEPILLNYLKTRSTNTNRVQSTTLPGDTVYFEKDSKKGKWLFPKIGSIENEFCSIIEAAFAPYQSFVLKDFLSDLVLFGKKNDLIKEILPDFHIPVEEVDVDSDGNYKRIPELAFVFKEHVSGLERFISDKLLDVAKLKGYSLFQRRLEQYNETYRPETHSPEIPDPERIKLLVNLVEDFPFDSKTPNIHEIREVCEYSAKSIQEMFQEIKLLKENLDKKQVQGIVDKFYEKVIEHTRTKSTLYAFEIDKFVANSKLNASKSFTLEIEISKLLESKLGAYESKTIDGKRFYYLVELGYMSAVLFNLKKLSLENESYIKQFEAARQIERRAQITSIPLDTKLLKEQALDFREKLARLEEEEAKRQLKEEYSSRYNHQAGILGFFVSLAYFIGMYYFTEQSIFLYLCIPVCLATAYLFSRLFRSKSLSKKSNSLESNKELDFLNTVINATENTLFQGEAVSVVDMFHDRRSLRESILTNLSQFKKNIPALSKEKNDEKILTIIEHAIINHSAVIQIPSELIVGSKSDIILINKPDLKSTAIRQQIADYFKYELASAKNTPLENYFKFIINAIENDYLKYLRKTSVQKTKGE